MVASFHFSATFSAFLVQQKGMLFFENFVPLFMLPLFSLFLAFCIPQNAITMDYFIRHFRYGFYVPYNLTFYKLFLFIFFLLKRHYPTD